MVGLIYNENDQWKITQIFCDHRSEEQSLLAELQKLIQKRHLLITYNGHAFDLPYLNERYRKYNMDFRFSMAKHFDLYRVVRASKSALNLPNYKLKTIEEYLKIYRDDEISGKESVELYELYEQKPSEALRDKILLHNFDDIKFMVPTLQILNDVPYDIIDRYYPFTSSINEREWTLQKYNVFDHVIELECEISTHHPPLSDYRDGFSCDIDKQQVKLSIPIFKIDTRSFIDIDSLPFMTSNFNNLDISQQMALEIHTKKDGYNTISNLLNEHYFK